MTDIGIINKCTRVELDAIMKGLLLRQIDERENLVELALNLRYTLNAKKVNPSKLKLDKQRGKVERAYRKKDNSTSGQMSDFAQRVAKLNEHFANQ